MTNDEALKVAKIFMTTYRDAIKEDNSVCTRMFSMANAAFPEINWESIYLELLVEIAVVNMVMGASGESDE